MNRHGIKQNEIRNQGTEIVKGDTRRVENFNAVL